MRCNQFIVMRSFIDNSIFFVILVDKLLAIGHKLRSSAS